MVQNFNNLGQRFLNWVLKSASSFDTNSFEAPKVGIIGINIPIA